MTPLLEGQDSPPRPPPCASSYIRHHLSSVYAYVLCSVSFVVPLMTVEKYCSIYVGMSCRSPQQHETCRTQTVFAEVLLFSTEISLMQRTQTGMSIRVRLCFVHGGGVYGTIRSFPVTRVTPCLFSHPPLIIRLSPHYLPPPPPACVLSAAQSGF